MLRNIEIDNESEISGEWTLRQSINEIYEQKESRKYYFSVELTPKLGLQTNLIEFDKKPVFVALTWIRDDNLNFNGFVNSPTIRTGKNVKNSHVVHHLSCFNLSEEKLDNFLEENSLKSLFVVRGGNFHEFLDLSSCTTFFSVLRRSK